MSQNPIGRSKKLLSDSQAGKQQELSDLTNRFRKATDPEEVKRLGNQLGRIVFGDWKPDEPQNGAAA